MKRLTHFDEKGGSKMVDVSEKEETMREAIAKGKVKMRRETLSMIADKKIAKGDVYEVARIAGIMAAKRVDSLIPMCHPLMITGVDISFESSLEKGTISIKGRVRTIGKTGVEMEALTAVAVASLTIYDMCKAVDRDIIISDIMLVMKDGGESGRYLRDKECLSSD